MSEPKPPKYNPIIPDGINVSPHNPIKEFAILTLGALTAIAAIGATLWLLFTSLAHYIPYSWERKLASSVLEVEQPDATAQQLQTRVDALLAAMADDNNFEVDVHYLESDIVNAFATVGGQIFIYQGLLDALESDIGLDMVLAHELAHVINRDPIQMAAGAVGTQLALALATSNGEFAQIAGLADISGGMLLQSYSRKQESQADQLALNAIHSIYGTVSGAEELFVHLQSQQLGTNPPEFLSSHPDLQSRIDAVRTWQQP